MTQIPYNNIDFSRGRGKINYVIRTNTSGEINIKGLFIETLKYNPSMGYFDIPIYSNMRNNFSTNMRNNFSSIYNFPANPLIFR
ncbi:MAG: hypothetical protein LBT66_06960 [Methanobrevibacter sp.]|jgi:hypothetical protein|nr:hypothetical protein [Candidatus Methanovirga meridionalis]